MTDPTFTRPGAVDLSGLTSLGAASGGPAGASYVVGATEADLQGLAQESMQYPVIMEFHSPRDPNGAEVSDALKDAVNAAEGRFLLARVDVDAEPRLAQALGVQAVPTVIAIIGGQMAPLFQGTRSRDEVAQVLDSVAQAAIGGGMTGRAKPVSAAVGTAASPAEPPADPRFAAADEALAAGDYERAVAEFDTLLKSTPNDAEVIAGRAQAALLARSLAFDPAEIARRAQEANDVEAQLDAADLEVIQGANDQALDRLLGLMADLPADEREPVRVRILELFEIIGRTDPVVGKARRRLSSLLF